MSPAEVKRGLAEMLVHLGAMGDAYASQARLIREALLLIEANDAPNSPPVCGGAPCAVPVLEGDQVPGVRCVGCED